MKAEKLVKANSLYKKINDLKCEIDKWEKSDRFDTISTFDVKSRGQHYYLNISVLDFDHLRELILKDLKEQLKNAEEEFEKL